MEYRDPNNYQLGFVVTGLGLALWGGLVGTYRRVRAGRQLSRWALIRRSIGEMVLSLSATFLVSLLCYHFQLDKPDPSSNEFFVFKYPLTCLSMWVAAFLAPKVFDLIDEVFIESRQRLLNEIRHGQKEAE